MRLAWSRALFLTFVGSIAAAGASDVTLRGQVACSACWFEADRSQVPYGGPADQACAARCAKDGIPPALAVADSDAAFTLYLVEARNLALGEAGWLPWIGKRVELRGALVTEGERPKLMVDALESSEEEAPAATSARADDPFALRLPDLSGIEQDLRGLLGRVVVVNFWATWCAPCRKEMPLLSRIQRQFAARGVQFIGAAADSPAEASAVAQFVARAAVEFPVWLGATTDDTERAGLPPILPGTVVLDRDGRIVKRLAGVVHEDPLVEAIERALTSIEAADRSSVAPRSTPEVVSAPAVARAEGRARVPT